MQRKQSARTPAATGAAVKPARDRFRTGRYVRSTADGSVGFITGRPHVRSFPGLADRVHVHWITGPLVDRGTTEPAGGLRTEPAPLGFIVYEGPSAIDSAPIVAIVNAIDESGNGKTGSLVQSWILRSDVEPTAAARTGADASVCGGCVHRPILAATNGAARCYVNLGRAPLGIFRAYRRGGYVRVSPGTLRLLMRGRRVRLGSYGDPAAVPAAVWRAYVADAVGHTGYSHQWRDIDAAEWAPLVMASVDSIEEQREAAARGFRTFRVSLDAADLIPGAESMCPASREAGNRAQCADCLLCGGTAKRARSIRILDHAAGWQRRVINIRAVGA